MAELCQVFSAMGFASPQSIIASGNLLFEAESSPDTAKIEKKLAEHFGFQISVVMRSISQIEALIAQNPFAGYENSSDTKLYLTMSSTQIGDALNGLESVPGDFDLIGVEGCDFFTAAFRQPNGRYGAGLDKLEGLFKHQVITTRNWNTILRILKKAKQ